MVGAKSMQELIMGFQVFVIMISHCIYFARENIRCDNCQYSNSAYEKPIAWLAGLLMNKFYYNPAKIKTHEEFGVGIVWRLLCILEPRGGLFLPFELTQFCLGPGS